MAEIFSGRSAHPEACITIFGAGLFLGWGPAWLLAHREIKVNRTIIDGLKEQGLSKDSREAILAKSLPGKRDRPIWLQSFTIIVGAAIVAAIVAYSMLPKTNIAWRLTPAQQKNLKSALPPSQKNSR